MRSAVIIGALFAAAVAGCGGASEPEAEATWETHTTAPGETAGGEGTAGEDGSGEDAPE